MSYQSISVKEAVLRINSAQNGWLLPAIQRPYVWGSRYESELYICKLFDSILRGYPIGGLIIWNTEEAVPYREFVQDYHEFGDQIKIVEKGQWERHDKGLVYDGQQRLQTLYSCLRYTFNDKVLTFDLSFDRRKNQEPDETGFSFRTKNEEFVWNIIRMNELFLKQSKEQKLVEKDILKKAGNLDEDTELLVCTNLQELFNVFVAEDKKSLAYFPISSSSSEDEVNDIFQRLNSGGIPLSLSDLLLSDIKERYPLFEERLQAKAKEIYNKTGKGFTFNAYNILQLLFLLVKKQVRVDPKRIRPDDIHKFDEAWSSLEKPLVDFFADFIWGKFKINNSSIVPKKILLLPLIVYFTEIYKKGYTFKNISQKNLNSLNQFFIKSQINDWSLQSYIDHFSTIIVQRAAGEETTIPEFPLSEIKETTIPEFPLSEIEEYVSKSKKRLPDMHEESFVNYKWFALKVLTPRRVYQFEPDSGDRFNPEIDHIFPRKPKQYTKEYEQAVDVIWNMQPTKGEINGYKTNYHPREFFTDQATNAQGDTIKGRKYLDYYDFLLPVKPDSSIDFEHSVWGDAIAFIDARRKLMIEFLSNTYGLNFAVESQVSTADGT